MSYLAVFEHHKTQTAGIIEKVYASSEDWLAEDIEASYGHEEYGPEAPEAVAAFEALAGFGLPAQLKAFYLSRGGFRVFDSGRHLSIKIPSIGTLLAAAQEYRGIHAAWPSLYGALATYGTPEEFADLPARHLERMRQDLFIFGFVHYRYIDLVFFAFDRAGRIFPVVYEHDSAADAWDERYRRVGEGEVDARSIDALLEPHIAACTRFLVESLDSDAW
jgi:hypothetical protein